MTITFREHKSRLDESKKETPREKETTQISQQNKHFVCQSYKIWMG